MAEREPFQRIPALFVERRAYWGLGLLCSASLLLPPGSLFRVAGAALLLFYLTGRSWSWFFSMPERPLPIADRLDRVVLAAGISYAVAICALLALSYLPGSVPSWSVFAVAAVVVAAGVYLGSRGGRILQRADVHREMVLWALPLLVLGCLFRFHNLGYSEFQGDESLAMISAAESLEGHEDALFLRGKGPGEVLVPMALWSLTGVINETSARLPFTIASIGTVLTMYAIGRRLSDTKAGGFAAALLALNGFAAGFGRIVQYQALVMWMSALAFLAILLWRDTGYARYAALSGVFVGVGLLAHYDALLVIPAIAYVAVTGAVERRAEHGETLRRSVTSMLPGVLTFAVSAGLFYTPYILDPQASRTGEYLGSRIGDRLPVDNLGSFLHFSFYYNSSYYVLLLAVLVCLPILLGQHARWKTIFVILSMAAVLCMAWWPPERRIPALALVPFLCLFVASMLSDEPHEVKGASLWLAVPFIGYVFFVALPLTHIYTVYPAACLLAGIGLSDAWDVLCALFPKARNALIVACVLLASLFCIHLDIAFLRESPSYWQQWEQARSPLFWYPFDSPPPRGFFGFVHRVGWKGVGQLYAAGDLQGDYYSNEEPEVTTWYTRGQPRACDAAPEYYFIANQVVDRWEVDEGAIEADYGQIGFTEVAEKEGLRIYRAAPAGDAAPNKLDLTALGRAYDSTATPAAFARSARGAVPVDANLGGLVRLVGYSIDTRRAYPGGRLPVTLYWQAIAPIDTGYHVFTHLEDEALRGQADGVPVCWTYPTDDWRVGQVIADQHAIIISEETPPGEYPLQVGMYEPESGRRLDVLDAAGNPTANSVTLTTVAVTER